MKTLHCDNCCGWASEASETTLYSGANHPLSTTVGPRFSVSKGEGSIGLASARHVWLFGLIKE